MLFLLSVKYTCIMNVVDGLDLYDRTLHTSTYIFIILIMKLIILY